MNTSTKRGRRLAAERKAQGLCVRCGKPLDAPDFLTCTLCRSQERDYRQRREACIPAGPRAPITPATKAERIAQLRVRIHDSDCLSRLSELMRGR